MRSLRWSAYSSRSGIECHSYLSGMHRCSVCFLLLLPALVAAQHDVRIRSAAAMDQAELLSFEHRYTEALARYQEGLALYPTAHGCLVSALAALEAKDTTAAIALLRRGVRLGLDQGSIDVNPPLVEVLKTSAAIEFHTESAADLAHWESVVDHAAVAWLDSLVRIDQHQRSNPDHDPERLAYHDSLHMELIIQRCEAGWMPNDRTLGQAIGDFHLLLWHHRGNYHPEHGQWKRILPHLHRAINAGGLPPDLLCMFDDHAAWEAGCPMPWGVLIFYFRNVPEELLLDEISAVNARRTTLGLGTVQDALRLADVGIDQVRFAAPPFTPAPPAPAHPTRCPTPARTAPLR